MYRVYMPPIQSLRIRPMESRLNNLALTLVGACS